MYHYVNYENIGFKPLLSGGHSASLCFFLPPEISSFSTPESQKVCYQSSCYTSHTNPDLNFLDLFSVFAPLYVSCLTYFSRLSAYEREKFHKPLPVLTVHWVSSTAAIFDAHITVVCVSVEGNAKFIRILSIKDQDRDRR